MKAQSPFAIALIVLAGSSFLLTPVGADEAAKATSADAFVSRLRELESEVAALRAEGPGHAIGPSGGCDGAACAPCCEPAGCDCCCAPCYCPCGWYAGGEFIWMEPRLKGFDAAGLNVDFPGASLTSTVFAHNYDYEATGRFWAGYTGCNGFGLRSSWWEFDHDSDPLSIGPLVGIPGAFVSLLGVTGVFAPIGGTFVSRQSLELETVDFEATGAFDACGGRFVAGFGLRYVRAHVQTSEQALDAVGTVERFGEVSDRFEGFGPTLALEYFRPLYFSGWSFCTNLRGTVALGEQRRAAQRVEIGAFTALESREADETLAIAELQIALQWCRGGWFARAGWQAQYWDDVASSQTGIAFVDARTRGNTGADLGLQGFFAAVGAQY